MGRQCYFPGCKNGSGLHSFPTDPEMRRRWLKALGQLDHELPQRAGICNLHFGRDCFSNLMEVDMGCANLLLLKSDAVPNSALPAAAKPLAKHLDRAPPARPQPQHLDRAPPATSSVRPLLHLMPKPTREIGCQTDRILTKHFFQQADVKPYRRSKATQTRPVNRSVSCDTSTLEAIPVLLAIPEVPVASSTTMKRPRCELSTDGSSSGLDVTDGTTSCTSNSNETPPHEMKKYIVYEDHLMELFERCPVCTQSCVIDKTVIGSLLQVKQSCVHCWYSNQWSSQPLGMSECDH
ncbi:uncharacterized protein ACJ7VT_002155 isoform 1-T2 [Polymixia lowei]